MKDIAVIPVYPPGDSKAEKNTNLRWEQLRSLAAHAKRYRLVADPKNAKIVVFFIAYALNSGHVDPLRRTLKRHPDFRPNKSKSQVFDTDDQAVPFGPGLYMGVDERWYDHRCHRTGPYIHEYLWNDDLDPGQDISEPAILFSFVGAANTHRCRQHILKLNYKRSVVEDTTNVHPWKDESAKDRWRNSYADSLRASKFVLCPRGRATSSVRVYEAMRAGRVPVIVSDAWIPPVGPDWESCSVRIAESEIAHIPALLEKLEPDFPRMATSARRNWEDWFSKEVLFDRISDWLSQIDSRRNRKQGWELTRPWRFVFSSPYQLRRCVLRPFKNGIKHCLGSQ